MVETLNIKHYTLHKRLFNEAKKFIPGGVNSPVRSFKAVGGYPVFVSRARGCKIYGECQKEFIDYCLGYGSLILGHSNPAVLSHLKNTIAKGTVFGTPTTQETEMAKIIIGAIPSIEKIRFVNSGTEAVMTAIRLARAFTKKDKIIKFQGCYHGHADYLLDCPGIPKGFKRDTITCPYNDTEKLEGLVKKHKNQIAAIIVEPVAGNMGVVLPKKGFLAGLRNITKKNRIILIFDEVITGFRLTFGGAQDLFGIRPDLTCLGKIIGGGLPIGAVGGKKEIMDLVSPAGVVYQAGTFSGNPVSINAGLKTLQLLSQNNPYRQLQDLTRNLCKEIKNLAQKYKIKLTLNFIGSMFSIFFIPPLRAGAGLTDKDVLDYNIAKRQDTKLFKRFYHSLLKEGVYLAPSGFEANFLSTAHTTEDIEKTLVAVEETFKNLKGN